MPKYRLMGRVADHRRLQTSQREPLVKLEHMPLTHQKYLAYNADEFSLWAMSVGQEEVQHFLTSGTAPEQGYKAYASLTKLGERYGRERLGLLVTAEWNRRQTITVKRLIHNAYFAAPFAAVEEISYYEDRKLEKAQMLRFSTYKFVDEGYHIIIEGFSGNDKPYIAGALGNAACRRFKKARYVRIPELFDEPSIASNGGELKKCLVSCKKVDLLILDKG